MKIAYLLLLLPALVACDVVYDRMGIPVPEKVEAEGKAIGSACRHAGRGLEDCYALNPKADKAAIHGGWKEMNEYMIKNKMESMAPEIARSGPKKANPAPAEDAASKEAEPPAGNPPPGESAAKK